MPLKLDLLTQDQLKVDISRVLYLNIYPVHLKKAELNRFWRKEVYSKNIMPKSLIHPGSGSLKNLSLSEFIYFADHW